MHVGDDLDHIRVGEMGRIFDGVGRCADHAVGALRQLQGAGVDELRVDQGLIALHVHHGVVAVQAEQLAGLGQAIAAGGVVGTGHDASDAVGLTGGVDAVVVGGDHDLAGLALRGALGHADHHGQAGDVGQRLVGQAGGGQTGRDQDGEAHVQASGVVLGTTGMSWSSRGRASFSSITGMPSWMGKARRSARQIR